MEIIKIVNNPHLGKLVIVKLNVESVRFINSNNLHWSVSNGLPAFSGGRTFDDQKFTPSLEKFRRNFEYAGFPIPAKKVLQDIIGGIHD